jgi:hypothetical protein
MQAPGSLLMYEALKKRCRSELVEGLQRWQLRDNYVLSGIATIELLLRRTLVRSNQYLTEEAKKQGQFNHRLVMKGHV